MSFQRLTLESSEKEEWIPVSGHWDDIIMLLGCIVEVKWMTPANYLLIAVFVQP
ncbi:WPE palindromic element domain-containing protein [Wolbachia endosymbiont of Ctenocephalides felis wCfeJ]|uniref:WPE palindromic element domain-containing protein n=1 Tax=Wolbachia endosymbiont of Ctenocephalides felis wCfeJ TaxID=2732594 RepID=UPI0014467EE8|nr:WPE palindromic element domain-containing protein [Wolbachia endosymbiont of Ctenocephalides felis wCfeJ]